MSFSKRCMTVLVSSVVMLQLACEHTITGPVVQWESLGFEDKFSLRLVLAEPYLYVCAGSDGVWRRDVRRMSEWQYLGLRDASLGKYTNVGVLDIDILGEDILIAYNPLRPEPRKFAIIWRSVDGGRVWTRSDDGIQDSSGVYAYISSVQRSPHNPSIALTSSGAAVFRSTDGGKSWNLSGGRRGAAANMDFVRWNPNRAGEAWFFGETSVFAAYMFRSTDYGETFGGSVNFITLGFPPDNAVNDIAFDAGDPDIAYAATSYGIIKTTDGGYTWRTNAIRLPDDGFVFRMAHHSSIAGVLYLAGGRRVYATRDGGANVRLFGEIERGFITALVLDIQRNMLFVGTTQGGIYALKTNGL